VNLLRDGSSYFDGSRDSRTDGKGDSTDPQHRSSAPPAGLTPSVSESGDDCKGKQGRMLVAVRACWYFFLSVFMYDNPLGNSYYAQHDPFQIY